jgi:hypothetical protein
MYTPPPSVFTLAETAAVQVTAQDLAQPNLTAQISVPVDFHCGQALALRGQPARWARTAAPAAPVAPAVRCRSASGGSPRARTAR